MANVYAVSNGNWNTGATWNTGTVPTAADDVFSNNFTVNVDVSFTVLTLRSTAGTGITAGGSFNFNTAGVTGTVTSASPLVPGATNMVQVTATTGTVTISLGGNVGNSSIGIILKNNACNLIINGTNINGPNSSGPSTISNTGLGTLTVNANLFGGSGSGGNRAISQSAGNLIVNGGITGGSISSQNAGISFSGTSLTVNGNINGSVIAPGIETSGTINNITGNVTAGTVAAISSTSANIINVTGTVTASATANAITSTNANGQVYLNGNMVNNNGKMAIFAPIVWLDKNNTTSAAFFTSGGVARTLYSADTVPNTPAANNVRSGTIYGAGNSLRGTVVIPTAANVRNGVTYDNGTTGTALFTTSLFLTELSSSTVPVAVRMQNLCTPMILGELMEAYKR